LLFQENISPFAFRYSLQNNKWTTIATMKRERCNFSFFVVSGRLYAIGGDSMQVDTPRNEDSFSACECYNPHTDEWLSVQPIPVYRTEHAGATWRHFLFVSGGLDRDIVLSSMCCYNTKTDVWEHKTPMLTPRAGHVMLVMGQRLYVCGGWFKDAETKKRNLIETIDVYDITTDKWTVATYIPILGYQGGIVRVDTTIYFIGGLNSEATSNHDTGMLIFFIKFDIFTAKSHISIE
jgi:N-acetylneuraminic acid mutarotase